jgi:Alpha-(1,6)-fucosyltransferase N- and catalytic domains
MKLTKEELQAKLSEPEKTLVYSFGCNPNAGFNADCLGLLAKLMACLQLGIGLRLCKITLPQGFVTQNGWTDYFEPFCDEATGPLLDRINRHHFPYGKKFPVTKYLARYWLKSFCRPRADYFMFDDLGKTEILGPPIFEPNEDYLLARRDLIRILWTYSPETREEVEAIKQEVRVPKDYLAINVRRGDKIIEHAYVGNDCYAGRINSLALGIRSIFIATDDGRVIPEISQVMPDYEFISLAERNSKGYVHSDFKSLPSAERRRRILRLLAELELMRDANLFIGSKTTNVSWMANAHRGGEGVIWVD